MQSGAAKLRRMTWWLIKPFVCLLYYASSILAWFILSTKSKRILFMASLYTHLQKVDFESYSSERLQEYLHSLNARFHLTSHRERAMLLPLMLHQYIWQEYDRLNENIEGYGHNDVSLILQIIRSTPMCLQYNRSRMFSDAAQVVEAVDQEGASLDLEKNEPMAHPLEPTDPCINNRCIQYRSKV